ncbi:hypothetical protein A9P82_06385 [Arachidicoccus ginsenosidimutans]|uniref:fluoride efflux transporter CrcB n=1 Tax=Arachidicoccus sp. BS20 TaxID=1850526 RepID=UPI0007F168AE|nr:fluoride efflux transporter CrcB [Arachidicoccus sp. BS20]ANI88954.1 hypothetical protein A9P82_06385 [Arachidicoccus sp. BS20]
MKPILFVGLGGAIGSICRYLAQVGISKIIALTFPLGTFIVNIAGCFIIGLLYGLATRQAWFTAEWRLFLITGICGGFTTFSSYSYESVSLMNQGNYLYFVLYAGCSVILGFLATWCGTLLFK